MQTPKEAREALDEWVVAILAHDDEELRKAGVVVAPSLMEPPKDFTDLVDALIETQHPSGTVKAPVA